MGERVKYTFNIWMKNNKERKYFEVIMNDVDVSKLDVMDMQKFGEAWFSFGLCVLIMFMEIESFA